MLTPSELVFIHAERFIDRPLFGEVKLPHQLDEVSVKQLVMKIAVAAFVSDEAVELILLSVEKRRRFFGLIPTSILEIFPSDIGCEWPTRSMEYKIWSTSKNLSVKDARAHVKSIVYDILGSQRPDPWRSFLFSTQFAVAIWLHYHRVGEEFPLVGPWKTEISADLGALSSGQSIAPVEHLIAGFEEQNTEKARLLSSEIQSAFVARTERGDWD